MRGTAIELSNRQNTGYSRTRNSQFFGMYYSTGIHEGHTTEAALSSPVAHRPDLHAGHPSLRTGFPVTLYKEQWLRILASASEIETFIHENNSKLKTKE